MTDSRNKGARGEREVAKLLTEAGFDAYRGQQFSGGTDSPDVVCHALKDDYHFEVKHVERLNLYNAMAQACKDAKPSQTPVVIHKKNRKSWLITTLFSDWIRKLKTDSDQITLTFPIPDHKLGYSTNYIETTFSESFKEALEKKANASHYQMEGKTILLRPGIVLMTAIEMLFK